MTQESLAQAAGVSVDAVGTLERGARQVPRADTARLLADALGLESEDRQHFLSAAAPHPRRFVSPRPAGPATGQSLSPGSPLPLPLTPMVGREDLVDEVRRLIAPGPRRLITLIGPGGVGKTRVAMTLAAAASDTVGWVDLAALSDPGGVPYSVAEAAGVSPSRGTSLIDSLRQWAARSRGLLVLDNCEHLLDAVAELVGPMLAGPDGVRVLATSRERLGVPGEHLVVVAPLRLPALGTRDPGAEAVRLFADRAAQAAPGFVLDGELLDRVTSICRALDGLPLAIELAAARVGTLTVDDLASHLDIRFDLLSSSQRGVDPRHHTLRAVIDWSYNLLSENERLVFARLSVFAAAFDLAAAEAVAADEHVPASQVAHLVARLADRSMLTRPGHAGVGQYRMLDTLRAYAVARLSPEELSRVRQAHARYLVEMVERADEGLAGPDEATYAERIEARLDDARLAFAWARDAGQPDLAVRLVAALARWAYWRMRPDVLAWGESVVQAVPDHPLLPAGYAAAAAGAWQTGRLEQGQAFASCGIAAAGGLATLAAVTPPEMAVDCGFLATRKSGDANHTVSAWPLSNIREAVLHDASLRDELRRALSATRQVTALTAPGTAARAIGLAKESVVLSDLSDPTASPTAREAVAHGRASGNPTALAWTRFAEGKAAAEENADAALTALDEASAVAADVGCRLVSALALAVTVVLRGRHGSTEKALTLYHEVIGLWRVSENETLLVALLSNLGILFARIERDAEAVEIASTLRHALPPTVYGVYGAEAERVDAALADTRARLGSQRYDAAWSAGARRSVDEAAERAQQLLAEHAATTRPFARASSSRAPRPHDKA